MCATPVEISHESEIKPTLATKLEEGCVFILRGLSPIKAFRKHLIRLSSHYGEVERVEAELLKFYESGTIPSPDSIYALRCGIRLARDSRLLSQCLAPLIQKMGFFPPVLLDGGINRLVLPSRIIDEIRRSGRLEGEDFLRERADGPTETFMPGPANIHRDFNRDHYLFQCNIWFPLHDTSLNDTLRIWPQLYREAVFDMDATPDNLAKIGHPLPYVLHFGDAIVFHGEHLHTSPARPHGTDGWRRHTFDFRIASHCADDNRHYRYNFLDLSSFIPGAQQSESRIVTVPHDFNCDYKQRFLELRDSALFYILAIEKAHNLSHQDLANIFEIFRVSPFAEDRFMLLLEKALEQVAVSVAHDVADYLIQNSQRYFWLFKLGQVLAAHALHNKAQRAMNRAYEVATATGSELRHFMPVKYVQKTTQILPGEVANIADHYLKTSGKN